MCFMASVDDNMSGKASVVCIDAQSGTIRWRYSVRGSVRSSIAASEGLVLPRMYMETCMRLMRRTEHWFGGKI